MTIRLDDRPMTWVFAGDSITQAVFHTHGARGWVEHCHERIRWQLDRMHDVVINTGMSGWTAPEVLDSFDHLIARFRPDVVSLSLGTNDAYVGTPGDVAVFESALRQLVARSSDLGAQVAVHTPAGITLSAEPQRPDLAGCCEVVRRVANESGALLVDHDRHWREAYPRLRHGHTEPIGWLDDEIHPGPEGHRVMADLTLETLGLGALEA